MNIIYASVLYTMSSGDKILANARFDATEAEMNEFKRGFSEETRHSVLRSFLAAMQAHTFMELHDASMNGKKFGGIAIIAVAHIAQIELNLSEATNAIN